MSTRKTLIIIVIALIVVFAIWYLSYMFMDLPQKESQKGPNNASDTTLNISGDLQQVPSDASVNGEMNSLDKDLQGF